MKWGRVIGRSKGFMMAGGEGHALPWLKLLAGSSEGDAPEGFLFDGALEIAVEEQVDRFVKAMLETGDQAELPFVIGLGSDDVEVDVASPLFGIGPTSEEVDGGAGKILLNGRFDDGDLSGVQSHDISAPYFLRWR
jgi:hypothetical protein